jgi:hypothetical protein
MRHAAIPARLLAVLVAGALVLAPTAALAKGSNSKAAAKAKVKAAAAAKAAAAKAKLSRPAPFVVHGTVVTNTEGVLTIAVTSSDVKAFRGHNVSINAATAVVTKWDEHVALTEVAAGAAVTVQGVGTPSGTSLTGLKALRVHDLTPVPPVEETPEETPETDPSTDPGLPQE